MHPFPLARGGGFLGLILHSVFNAMRRYSSAFAVIPIAVSTAQAFTVERFSPQGDVARVRQVAMRFSEPMVRLGDPALPAPVDIACAEPGRGRWLNPREWIYDFERDLPTATRCTFTLRRGLKALAGSTASGPASFTFNTGGPAVARSWPPQGAQIDEQQVFVIEATGAVDPASLRDGVSCSTDKLGERIAVAAVAGAERDEVLAALGRQIDGVPRERLVTLRCARPLPEGAAMLLTWSTAVTSAAPNRVRALETQRLGFRVRPAFRVSVSCERERADRPCIPLAPISVGFSAPVEAKLADAVRLSGGGKTRSPVPRDEAEATVMQLRFAPPFDENAEYTLELPKGLADDSGRAPANAASFPLKLRTGPLPALAKFAARFGIVERSVGALPVTVRNIESEIRGASLALASRELATRDDREVIRWMRIAGFDDRREYRTRAVSYLRGASDAKPLPPLASGKAAEVIGIALKQPGLHVVEIESQLLGSALLTSEREPRPGPMYVRAYALHTAMAVHLKTAQENGAVWVTSLDDGKPVAAAEVRVSDCSGRELWRGMTDAQGIARIDQALPRTGCNFDAKDLKALLPPARPAKKGASGESDADDDDGYADRGYVEPFLFASARKGDDYSFALSSWTRGIEPWRYNVEPVWAESRFIGHTIFDRSLLRAGDTVHMKHLLREESLRGLQAPAAAPGYDHLTIRHVGSDQTFDVPLKWLNAGTAISEWKIPAEAKLGIYNVALAYPDKRGSTQSSIWPGQLSAGSFQVAQFRLSVMQGSVTPQQRQLVAAKEAPLSLQLNYINGGPAAGEPVTLSALLRPDSLRFSGYDDFSFDVPEYDFPDELKRTLGLREQRETLVADKLPVTLDKQGAGRLNVPLGEPRKGAALLRVEMNYRDPSGEIQSIAANVPVWPAAVVLGIRQDAWYGGAAGKRLQWVVLDAAGKPVPGIAVAVQGWQRKTYSVRKRAAGGFYSYDNRVEMQDLGTVCEGTSDERGMVFCKLDGREGNVVLLGRAKDGSGNVAMSGTSLWIGKADVFAAEDSDRMDVLPAKRQVAAGETASLQVRMPFWRATAWVAVEREGVIDSFTADITRDKPEIAVPIKAEYAPNVYVSVLAVRPRLREAPWWSFFTWGWRSPREWWDSFRHLQPATAMVDLAKPAYRYGIAELQVGRDAQAMKVTVQTDKPAYQTRAPVKAAMRVLRPDGKPLAGAQVAVAVVDEALLELKPNESWNLLDALWRRRGYGVETATAQMQVIGRRHFGLKALPAGGGGGRAPTRELLDTLVYWNPAVTLDADGRAQLEFRLNDALTRFRLVALADTPGDGAQAGWFGTGSASFVATKDLQLIAGLPPLVRDADRFDAMVTLRNTTQRAMKVAFTARREDDPAAPPVQRTLELPAGASQLVSWPVRVADGERELRWKLDAADAANADASDSLRLAQRVVPAVPVTTWQATLLRLEQPASIEVQAPAGALPGRGGLRADFRASLVGSLEPVRRWFEQYPFVCLEQKVSKSIGLRDEALWRDVAAALPNYLDRDGLARYYPDNAPGSDALTSYLLAVTHEAGWLLPKPALDRMAEGLAAFVEGRIRREFWAPRKDLDMRKLAAIEALSRYGRARPQMLGSITITPQNWPTSAVIDWLSVLQRMPDVPQREQRIAEAVQVLRARLDLRGTKLSFSDERGDYWWWLMINSDVNAARLVLAALNTAPGGAGVSEWLQDLPRLVNGLVARQHRGVWWTTTANVWGALAVEKYARGFEREPVAGQTRIALEAAGQPARSAVISWSAAEPPSAQLPWPAGPGMLRLAHEGSGKPYVTLQSLAAVPLAQEDFAGYRIRRTVTPVSQKAAGRWSAGDVYRVTLDIDAQAAMTWVAVSDPVPAGATVLGSGLGRDSAIESRGEGGEGGWAAYEERSFEGYRATYAYLPKGAVKIEYTVRLNQPGEFALPPTRVDAMYAPDLYGALPNAPMKVE